MGKDRTQKSTQQTRMDQCTVQSSGASLQKDPPGPLEKGREPTGSQIVAAIESSQQAMQTQIVAIAVDVNLLCADLRVVAERSVATEKQVTGLQSEMDTLKASVAILEAKTHKLEVGGEDAEVSSTCGYSVCAGRTIGVSVVSEHCLDLNLAIEQERRSPPTSGL
ncbi:hypothetical protein NDU88_005593 [Pleurodeles waltl]|uniref:Uncharacterized protein n=1 Tax=Pleurodeles waltl TaxID=8319 RepID=A0AAV7VKE8_PLEWA|nr:hypothetical protein NDU88_005593 [Pleurodeles waltl]